MALPNMYGQSGSVWPVEEDSHHPGTGKESHKQYSSIYRDVYADYQPESRTGEYTEDYNDHDPTMYELSTYGQSSLQYGTHPPLSNPHAPGAQGPAPAYQQHLSLGYEDPFTIQSRSPLLNPALASQYPPGTVPYHPQRWASPSSNVQPMNPQYPVNLGDGSVKHMTCFFWKYRNGCRFSAEECLYAHYDTGQVAGPPIQVELGKPAVAGKNALKAKPIYRDWHGFHSGSPSKSNQYQNPPLFQKPRRSFGDMVKNSAELRAQIEAIHAKAAKAREEEAQAKGPRPIEDNETVTEIPNAVEDNTGKQSGSKRTQSPTLPPTPRPSKAARADSKTSGDGDSASILDLPGDLAADLIAENDTLRAAVENLSTIIAGMYNDSVKLRNEQSTALQELLRLISHLREPHQTHFLTALVTVTRTLEPQLAGENAAFAKQEEVRAELVKHGLGGLLTSWDRAYCRSGHHSAGESSSS